MRRGKLAKNTLIFTSALSLRFILQATLFVAVARTLGPEGYGKFVAVLSVMTFFQPLVGLGGIALLLRDTARNPELFPIYFARALFFISITAPFLLASALLVAMLILPKSMPGSLMISLALSELVCVPLMSFAARAYQAFERMDRMGEAYTFLIIVRLIGFAIMFLAHPSVNSETWGLYYLGASIVGSAVAVGMASNELGLPRWNAEKGLKALRDGFYFALGGGASRIHDEIDKTLLARLDHPRTAGIYSAGYRAIDIMILPLSALLESSQARFFRAGEHGPGAAGTYGLKLLPLPLTYAVLGGLLLYLFSPLIANILGSDYAESVNVARCLAAIPAIVLLRVLVATVAGASGLHRVSGLFHSLGAFSNIAMNIWLIPRYGWGGAVVATYCSEILMALAIFFAIVRANRK